MEKHQKSSEVEKFSLEKLRSEGLSIIRERHQLMNTMFVYLARMQATSTELEELDRRFSSERMEKRAHLDDYCEKQNFRVMKSFL